MRPVVTLILLFCLATATAQQRDTRALLTTGGKAVSVSPAGIVWLVSGSIFYSDNKGELWHRGQLNADPSESTSDHFEDISWFNKDTAILTGYIYSQKDRSLTDGYYLTRDGGKTWKQRSFGGDAWIYCAQVDAHGRAWLCGLSKTIYYSDDFAQRWDPLVLPYTQSERTYALYMISTTGIAGSDNDELLVTTDNWQHATHIPTPHEQGQCLRGGQIQQVLTWQGYYLVKQADTVFYTGRANIDWQRFPVDISVFKTDNTAKRLYAGSADNRIVIFSTPTVFEHLLEKKLPGSIYDISIAGDTVYALSRGSIYRVSKTGLVEIPAYSKDERILEPQLVKKGNAATWGVDHKEIYKSDNEGTDWYRVKTLDFYPTDFYVEDDHHITLLDGMATGQNYRYSEDDNTLERYTYTDPLSGFLKHAVILMSIEAGSSGCFHSESDKLEYLRKGDHMVFAVRKISSIEGDHIVDKEQNVPGIEVAELSAVLENISKQTDKMPSLAEFSFSAKDKANYLSLLAKKPEKNTFFNEEGRPRDTAFYRRIFTKLDTLSSETLKAVLDKKESIISTTMSRFRVMIVNTANDTLEIESRYYHEPSAWHLPWLVTYKGIRFNSYSIALSRLVKGMLPNGYRDRYIFSNRYLLLDIADHLYFK